MEFQVDHGAVPRDILDHAVMDLRIVFSLYQTKGKSTITLSQLREIIDLLGKEQVSYSELATMVGLNMEDLAQNTAALYDARLDFKDFVRFFVNHIDGSHLSVQSKEIFRAMDCDDSGEITAEELEESLTSMGMTINREEAIAMTSIADTSTDQMIEYAEFKGICKRIDKHIKEEKMDKKQQQKKKQQMDRSQSWFAMNKNKSVADGIRKPSLFTKGGRNDAGPSNRV